MAKSTTAANAILNYHVRGTTPSALTPYLGLLTAYTAETEVTGGSYARVAMTTTNFSSAAASKSISNTVEIAFPQSSGAYSAEVVGFGVYDASTAGNLMRKSFLVSGNYLAFTADQAADTLLIPGHALINTDRVVLQAGGNSTMPTGLSADTLYFVVGMSGNTLQLSTTSGGAAINFTAIGAGLIAKVIPQTINAANITPKFATGAITFNEV